ncbi:hypothetical protein ebA3753 [Aromatoleum aromaticum EbN1]|uniref:Uncharacterized protein n=1 Tax=Aromatoleum aromaticum (strain DSM 19018 / LMG 30748 / EbN1) TaxID=76114 RepID=Q5P374_AROAE|nr:hypothetical protein [Aromatoleum aromaticum]CAI08240.1 hypothetical protein ebA3753 [Aromatoleum aromaticum EbN1]
MKCKRNSDGGAIDRHSFQVIRQQAAQSMAPGWRETNVVIKV